MYRVPKEKLEETRKQVPEGTNGRKLPFAKSRDTICQFNCPHLTFIPVGNKGKVDYKEEYAGWNYCLLFKIKLRQKIAGSPSTKQVHNCPLQSIEEEAARVKRHKLQEEIISLKEELRDTNEKIVKYFNERT